ncbi:MAG: phenylalanine--tRNA ligase beta subunit-related protein [Pseudomonadota bacterium]|nr:phenylalanine--tRNA ligase beta subunit-related protein [Pseudomonadota bacterium]
MPVDITFSEDFANAGIRPWLGIIEALVHVAPSDDDLKEALAKTCKESLARIGGTPVAAEPAIIRTRKAYRALGKDPARYRPAAEALLRRLVKDQGVFPINNVVDINNLISISTALSIGAFDSEFISPPVILREGGEGETYHGIGRGVMNIADLPVLADEDGPFGSPTSDSERTRVMSQTRRLLMVLYDFGDAPGLAETMEMTAELLVRHAKATNLETRILTGQVVSGCKL